MRFRFAEKDRERYGDGWLEIDPWRLDHVEGGLIEAFEDATGYTVMVTLPAHLIQGQRRARRALMWLAVLVHAGWDAVQARATPRWEDFWPDIPSAEYELPPADGDSESGNPPGPATNRAGRRAATKTAKKTTASTSTRGRSTAQRSATGSKTTKSS